MTLSHAIQTVQRIDVVPAILDTVCRLTGTGFATIARVTAEHWVACAVHDQVGFGLKSGGELQIEATFCDTVRRHNEPVVIDAASLDPVYKDHPIPSAYGFESYISVPIILPDGQFFGTLCALGRAPARLRSPEIIGTFTMFAGLIAMHLDAIGRTDAAEALLAEQRAEAEERDRFIAILGHDLRNPIAAMVSGTRLLQGARDEAEAQRIAGMMFATLGRMAKLVENVLDFAHARMGAGIDILPAATSGMERALRHVIDEMRVIEPDRAIEARFDLAAPVVADVARVTQLFANLLGNALVHGKADAPVVVEARSDAGGFTLSVANEGASIPPAVRQRMFRPFSRGEVRAGQQGLGLGLYIAAEIARVHGGTIDLVSDETVTCFTFRLPASAAALPGA
ncbi:GAF domain-containing sensor histidine kinase [Plastoroseomonas arctica]|uniref:histidine kinase n=1 Tax=Plastoroseomonas arctica TaxID=1509237 RepID=A0AAF1K274_9PROT|nr:GAF domain-containing sensor histidine kinase [Plastoroseomonas arctica]MBR0655191.1 GAF domain-containing sensor histidine kinase [Plastoroseomonas arctica]